VVGKLVLVIVLPTVAFLLVFAAVYFLWCRSQGAEAVDDTVVVHNRITTERAGPHLKLELATLEDRFESISPIAGSFRRAQNVEPLKSPLNQFTANVVRHPTSPIASIASSPPSYNDTAVEAEQLSVKKTVTPPFDTNSPSCLV
jgi:hypothetical protein